MTGADRGLQLEVIGLFREQAPAWRQALVEDCARWRDVAHTLKGAARGIGLEVLAAACEVAELADANARPAALVQVRVALDDGLAALEQFAADTP